MPQSILLAFIALLLAALYPVVRDVLRRRRSADPEYVQGLQALLDGNRAEAEARLREAVSQDTSNIDAYIRLGEILIEKGDTERGLRLHENLALRRNLKPHEEKKVYRTLARDYLRTDRKARAISVLEGLLHDDPSDLVSASALLGLYLDTGSWEKADALLKTTARGRGQPRAFATLYAEYGRARSATNPKAALAALNEALKLDPSNIVAQVYLGDVQLSTGDVQEAVRTWTELVERRPDRNALVRQRLERAFYELGRYEETTSLYERLLRRVPEDTSLAAALAAIYLKMERSADAIRLLSRAVKSGRANVAVKAVLALLESSQPDYQKAQELLTELATADDRQTHSTA